MPYLIVVRVCWVVDPTMIEVRLGLWEQFNRGWGLGLAATAWVMQSQPWLSGVRLGLLGSVGFFSLVVSFVAVFSHFWGVSWSFCQWMCVGRAGSPGRSIVLVCLVFWPSFVLVGQVGNVMLDLFAADAAWTLASTRRSNNEDMEDGVARYGSGSYEPCFYIYMFV